MAEWFDTIFQIAYRYTVDLVSTRHLSCRHLTKMDYNENVREKHGRCV